MAKKKSKHKNKIIILIAFLFLVVGFFLGINAVTIYDTITEKDVVELQDKNPFVYGEFDLDNGGFSSINIPAIDTEGNGVLTVLSVSAIPGSGKTLVDIDGLLFWADTQSSIRTAKLVAEEYTGLNLNEYDIIYNIQAEASLIGGPSAGTAIAIATIAALEGNELKEDVMITGSVNHDGTIGPVTGIVEKANAAKEIGANLFLVPLLQGNEVVYETKEYCREFGLTEFCTTETIPKKVNVAEEVGIEVKEVGSVKEALEYFYKNDAIE